MSKLFGVHMEVDAFMEIDEDGIKSYDCRQGPMPTKTSWGLLAGKEMSLQFHPRRDF